MGYRCQNKLDEENERVHRQEAPLWQRLLCRLAGYLLALLALVSGVQGFVAAVRGW